MNTPTTAELRRLGLELEAALSSGVQEAKDWLASEQGRRYRGYAATALALAAPAIMRHPFFRTPLGRALQVAGGATLLAKAAELIRDWEPRAVTES